MTSFSSIASLAELLLLLKLLLAPLPLLEGGSADVAQASRIWIPWSGDCLGVRDHRKLLAEPVMKVQTLPYGRVSIPGLELPV